MKKTLFVILFLIWTCSVTFAGNAGGTAEAGGDYTNFHDPFENPSAARIDDPLEPVNRAAFWINDQLYTQILGPLCQIVPPEVQKTLGSVLAALSQPLRLGPGEFQFRFRDAGSEIGRLILYGLYEMAHQAQPETIASAGHEGKDFGQTLEALGIGSGFYLVLPVFGPSSLRDSIGRLTSLYFDPTVSAGKSLLGRVHLYEGLRRNSLDPYLFFRNAYTQRMGGEAGKNFFSLADPDLLPLRSLSACSLGPASTR